MKIVGDLGIWKTAFWELSRAVKTRVVFPSHTSCGCCTSTTFCDELLVSTMTCLQRKDRKQQKETWTGVYCYLQVCFYPWSRLSHYLWMLVKQYLPMSETNYKPKPFTWIVRTTTLPNARMMGHIKHTSEFEEHKWSNCENSRQLWLGITLEQWFLR